MNDNALILEPELLSTAEVARRLGCSDHTLSRWVRSGEVRAQLVGKSYVFSRDAVASAERVFASKTRRRREYPAITSGDLSEYIGVRAAADRLGLTERQTWRLVNDGDLPGGRWEGHVLVRVADVEAAKAARGRA